jgi:hypothetical protein
MQVMPKLAAANPIHVPNVNDADGNIHADVKMMRNIGDTYFKRSWYRSIEQNPFHLCRL